MRSKRNLEADLRNLRTENEDKMESVGQDK
jgi:hypothetical protein